GAAGMASMGEGGAEAGSAPDAAELTERELAGVMPPIPADTLEDSEQNRTEESVGPPIGD
ncbi:MAG TPA: hypothetical protein VF099_04415, partial [Ktedonobacterales bacterium]